MSLKTNIITLLLIATCTFSFAQRRSSITGKRRSKSSKRRSQSGPINYINNIKGTFFLGASKYIGDIAGRTDSWNKANIAIGIGTQYRYNEHISFRGDMNLTRLTGDDAFSDNPRRNLSFKTNVYEFKIGGVYDLFKLNKMYRRRHKITPFGVLGFGVFHFNPKADLDGTTYNLRDYQTEDQTYSSISFSTNFGGGLRLKVTPQIDISFEVLYRKTFTDYLDDVSTIYPTDIASWDDPISQNLSLKQEDRSYESAAGGKRGNPDSKDGYVTFGFRLEYTLKVTQQRYNLKRNSSRLRMHHGIRKKR